MAEQFPPDLPLPLERGHSIQDSLHVRQNDVAIGPPRFELLSIEGPVTVKVTWIFTQAQMFTFELFFRDTIVFGSKSFNMAIASGAGLVKHEFHMASFIQTTKRRLWSVKADLIAIRRIIFETEPLAWNGEPVGTYQSISVSGLAQILITFNSLGAWEVSGVSNSFNDTDSGFYRPRLIIDDKISYEIKFTQINNSGGGSINPIGFPFAGLGTFVDLDGDKGLVVSDGIPAITDFSITVEIREKLVPTNTTGIASFVFKADGEAVEILAWDSEPTGTYNSISISGLAQETITVDSLGVWTISGVSNVSNDIDSGFYRPRLIILDDKISYEIKFTQNKTAGNGSVNPIGFAFGSFGTFVDLDGDKGVVVSDSVAGPTIADITVEIREKLVPTNTTGIASFILNADGS